MVKLVGIGIACLLVAGCTTRTAVDAGSEEDGGESSFPELCDNPAFTCADVDCEGSQCGPLEPFADNGCLRRTCEGDADCVDGDRCFRPSRFGRCEQSRTSMCVEEMGGCVCTVEGREPAYCVDAADYPSEAETPCVGSECGAPGSHSTVMDTQCFCDDGYGWCAPEDPDDFSCCA